MGLVDRCKAEVKRKAMLKFWMSLRQVKDAQSKQALIQRLADSIPGSFVYSVMTLFLATFAFWYRLISFYRSLSQDSCQFSYMNNILSELVDSMPCNMLLLW